jgi:hypothetical protein
MQKQTNKGDAGTLVDIREDHNKVAVNIIADMNNAIAGVQVSSNNCSVSVNGINTQTNKKLVNVSDVASGFTAGVIRGDTSDVYIEFNGASRDSFSFASCSLVQGNILFAGIGQNFTVRGGQYYSNVVPTNGVFEAGEMYKRLSFNSPANDETLFGISARLTELGRMYTGSVWEQMWAIRDLA